MDKNIEKQKWVEYRNKELAGVLPILDKLGFVLDKEQVHISGERYLMSGYKLVLTGKQKKGGEKVIIKTSSHPDGIKEIIHGHKTRNVLHNLNFSYRTFFSPEEILFTKYRKYVISVTSYVKQEKHFIDHSIKDQFFLALRAFETQEGAHATTYSHTKEIQRVFKTITARNYLESFQEFTKNALSNDPKNKELAITLDEAFNFLNTNKDTLKQYSNFLTHSDFAPHNLRVVDRDIYLLDHTSMHFGNKYEGWARFMNFMVHHNPELEQYLTEYVHKNKGREEYLSLRLMRVYKLGFLLKFYTQALQKTSGNLHKLTRLRISFWTQVLKSILKDEFISKNILNSYLKERDTLRSDAEKKRQQEIISKKTVDVS